MQEIWLIISNTAGNPMSLLRALIDIFFVAIPFYVIFALLRESRSSFALFGIVTTLAVSFVLYLAAKIFELQATALIYERFWIIVVLVFLIIFQSDLRKGLTDFGRIRVLRAFFQADRQAVHEVIQAVAFMAEKRIGALIVFERAHSLKPFLGTGTELDSEVSSEMLRAIFFPQSPLHDGATLIRGNRLMAAGVILPLTEDPRLSKDLGTRHRAAIGITEETDALVVVISEETGTISLAKEGKIERFLEPDDLTRMLERELHIQPEREDVHA